MAKKPTEELIGQFEIESVEVFKKGSGKRGPWRLLEIEFTNDEGDTEYAKGFDRPKKDGYFEEGEMVEVYRETTYDEDGDPEYENVKFREIKKGSKSSRKVSKKSKDEDDEEDEAPAKKSTSSAAGDKRILKLLTVIAAEVGIEEEEINRILEEK